MVYYFKVIENFRCKLNYVNDFNVPIVMPHDKSPKQVSKLYDVYCITFTLNHFKSLTQPHYMDTLLIIKLLFKLLGMYGNKLLIKIIILNFSKL